MEKYPIWMSFDSLWGEELDPGLLRHAREGVLYASRLDHNASTWDDPADELIGKALQAEPGESLEQKYLRKLAYQREKNARASRRWRLRRDGAITAKELAAALGVSPSRIYSWENGSNAGPASALARYEHFLDCVEDILNGVADSNQLLGRKIR